MSQRKKYLCELYYGPLDNFEAETIVYAYNKDDAAVKAKNIFNGYDWSHYYIKIWLFQRNA